MAVIQLGLAIRVAHLVLPVGARVHRAVEQPAYPRSVLAVRIRFCGPHPDRRLGADGRPAPGPCGPDTVLRSGHGFAVRTRFCGPLRSCGPHPDRRLGAGGRPAPVLAVRTRFCCPDTVLLNTPGCSTAQLTAISGDSEDAQLPLRSARRPASRSFSARTGPLAASPRAHAPVLARRTADASALHYLQAYWARAAGCRREAADSRQGAAGSRQPAADGARRRRRSGSGRSAESVAQPSCAAQPTFQPSCAAQPTFQPSRPPHAILHRRRWARGVAA